MIQHRKQRNQVSKKRFDMKGRCPQLSEREKKAREMKVGTTVSNSEKNIGWGIMCVGNI